MKEATMAASPSASPQPHEFSTWLESAAFLFMLFAGASLIATILVLLIVL
jgi:hypothetical protein